MGGVSSGVGCHSVVDEGAEKCAGQVYSSLDGVFQGMGSDESL